MLKTGSPARFDDWGGRSTTPPRFRVGYRSSAAAPIVVGGALWGAVAIASENPLPPDSREPPQRLRELVSLAVASAQARADLIASRARLVTAGDEQRRRLERNLHDGAQQHLVSVALKLRVARAKLERRPGRQRAAARRRVQELDTGLEELRELARGLHPGDPDRQRARPARCEALAKRLPIDGRARRARRAPARALEATTYYIVSEALTNVAKHAAGGPRARGDPPRRRDAARRDHRRRPRRRGPVASGTGILGLRDRAEAVGGMLTMNSPPGQGTVLAAALPLSARP